MKSVMPNMQYKKRKLTFWFELVTQIVFFNGQGRMNTLLALFQFMFLWLYDHRDVTIPFDQLGFTTRSIKMSVQLHFNGLFTLFQLFIFFFTEQIIAEKDHEINDNSIDMKNCGGNQEKPENKVKVLKITGPKMNPYVLLKRCDSLEIYDVLYV